MAQDNSKWACQDLQHNFHNTLMLSRFLQGVVALFAPDYCLVCRAVGSVLCERCRLSLTPQAAHCYRCLRPSAHSLTCQRCSRRTRPVMLVSAAHYEGLAKDVVRFAKYQPSRSAARELAAILAPHLPFLDRTNTLFVPIPTTAARRRERAFDQALEIARRLARFTGIECQNALRRRGTSHQVGATRRDRFAHMKDAFTVSRPAEIRGKTIVLVDDVMTTGATMEAAAKVVTRAGAARVIGVVFARA